MSPLAVMRCCATAPLLPEYEVATDAVLSSFGIGVVDLELNCCGYPMRNSRFEGWIRSSARNLALAERAKLDLVTVCSCCYGSLKQVDHLLRTDGALRESTNEALRGERLRCSGAARVRHLLEVLREDVGLDRIRGRLKRSFEGLRVACHYGCHLLRPSAVVRFDDPAAPFILDELVEATGAESVPWDAKLDCCGAPVSGVNDELSAHVGERKLRSAQESGADLLCVVCPYCALQLDRVRGTMARRSIDAPPVLLVHQLLGLGLGIAPEALGLAEDRMPLVVADLPKTGEARDG